MSAGLLQSLLALRKTCVQLKAQVAPPQAETLDLMTTMLAKLISDARDLPPLQRDLIASYHAYADEPAAGGYADAGPRLERTRARVQRELRRERELGTSAVDLKALAAVEAAFSRACDSAVLAELRQGRALNAPSEPQNEVFDAAGFRRYLIETLDEDPSIEIVDVKLASRGFSKKTILVQLRNGRVLPDEIALRIDRAFNFLGTTVMDEYAPLLALYAAGLRLPRPYALEPTGRVLDGPFIIFEKKSGGLIGNNFQSPVRNAAVAADVAQCLAQVHRTALAALPAARGAVQSPQDQTRAEIDKSYADWAALDRAEPVMEAAFNWLYANVGRAAGERAVVHGDYNFNNILIDKDRVSAIVDWEFLHVGNPAADLGWFYYGAEGICGWQEFLDLYHAAGGYRFDQACLDFFVLLGQTRLAVMILQTECGFNVGRFDELKFGLSGALYTNVCLTRVATLLQAVA